MITGINARKTYLELAGHKMASICDAFGVDNVQRQRLMSMLWLMMSPWGDLPVGPRPRILSDITDDHTPFEFSLAFRDDGPEFRILVEALASDPLIDSRWTAGLALNRRLEQQFGCSLERFHAIEELFRPSDEWARFAMWHAVNVGQKDTFKIYLNPNAHGPERASEVVKAALQRLGVPRAFEGLPEVRPGRDVIRYFSLDLTNEDEARIKIYFSHTDVGIAAIENFMEFSRHHESGEAASFCRTASGGMNHYDRLPLQTCYSFVGDEFVPDTVTLHFPVRSYAPDDHAALERITTLIPQAHREPYQRMASMFIGRDLESSVGAQTYVSYRRQHGEQRVTVYLSPNAYRGAEPALNQPSASDSFNSLSLSA